MEALMQHRHRVRYETRHLLIAVVLTISMFVDNSCKDDDSIVIPPAISADTTNHNFTWTVYRLGGNFHYNVFYDVAIVNDSLIYAVGELYLLDSLGREDPQPYNLATWNGRDWNISRVSYMYQGTRFTPPIYCLFALDKKNIWFAGGIMIFWDGERFAQIDDIIPVVYGIQQNRIWTNARNNIYVVGWHGTIVHYNGTTWSKMESGTTVNLEDVWGTPDGKTVWASGFESDFSRSVLLKYDGVKWRTVWERGAVYPSMPFYGLITGIWASNSYFYATSDAGIYRLDLSTDTSTTKKQPIEPIRGSHAIRGTPSGSSIAAVYEDGIIWHYDGQDWREVHTLTLDHKLRSLAVSTHLIVAVGIDNSTGKALIYMGRH